MNNRTLLVFGTLLGVSLVTLVTLSDSLMMPKVVDNSDAHPVANPQLNLPHSVPTNAQPQTTAQPTFDNQSLQQNVKAEPSAMVNVAPLLDRFLSKIQVTADGQLELNKAFHRSLKNTLNRIKRYGSNITLDELTQYIQQQDTSGQSEAITRLIEGYYGLLNAEAELLTQYKDQGASVEAALERLQAQSLLRKEWLGDAAANAFFGEQEQSMTDFLTADKSNVSAQPNTHTGVVANANQTEHDIEMASLNKEIESLKADGATEQELFELRANRLGTGHALDIAQEQAIAAAWQAKHDDFIDQKHMIAQSGLSESDQLNQIEVLLQSHYTEEELPAARAYHASQ